MAREMMNKQNVWKVPYVAVSLKRRGWEIAKGGVNMYLKVKVDVCLHAESALYSQERLNSLKDPEKLERKM